MDEQELNTQQDVRDEGSLAPVSLDRLTVEEEASLMNRGKGGKLAFVLTVGVLCVSGALFGMKHLDTARAYASAALSIDQLSNDKAETFLRCALPGVDSSQFDTREHLLSAIERVSDQLGKGYGRKLSFCMSVLDELEPGLAALSVPADAMPALGKLRQSAFDARQTWSGYRTYLSDSRRSYEYVQALPQIEKISVAWESYESQRDQLTATLRAHQ